MLEKNRKGIEKHREELQFFKGFLPFDFYSVISLPVRNEFLREAGLFAKVHNQNMTVKAEMKKADDELEYLESILRRWLKENPKFQECFNMD